VTSIRKRLLANLLSLFLFSWLAVAGYTYYEATHEIEELFDAQLAQTAGMIAELTLNKIEKKEIDSTALAKAVYGHKYERKVSFQIWENDILLLHSQSAPHERLSSQTGFSDRPIGQTVWRIFGMQHEGSNYTIYAAEDHEVREEMVSFIALGALLPLLWALPLLGVFIWLGVGRGLLPLQRVAHEVAERTPQQLTPIDSQGVPDEITPLTTSLNALLRKLREAFDLEKRFTADASHELRTPLAAIRTQAQVALRAKDADERNKALQNILTGIDRSSHLVEQMLTLARLEPEALSEDFKPVELATLAEEVIADLVPLASSRSIELSLLDNCPGCRVDGFRPGLAIMLRNLIDNAIRYTPDHGNVEISLFQDNGRCCLAVTDTGLGIPEEERERVFDRFYRQEGRNGYGCGLGLSIVRRIVHLQQAEITLADNPEGKGLRITIRFK
jgi:two-component system sensor histidine kinase QseC